MKKQIIVPGYFLESQAQKICAIINKESTHFTCEYAAFNKVNCVIRAFIEVDAVYTDSESLESSFLYDVLTILSEK